MSRLTEDQNARVARYFSVHNRLASALRTVYDALADGTPSPQRLAPTYLTRLGCRYVGTYRMQKFLKLSRAEQDAVMANLDRAVRAVRRLCAQLIAATEAALKKPH